jgi:hypothetical protein
LTSKKNSAGGGSTSGAFSSSLSGINFFVDYRLFRLSYLLKIILFVLSFFFLPLLLAVDYGDKLNWCLRSLDCGELPMSEPLLKAEPFYAELCSVGFNSDFCKVGLSVLALGFYESSII